MSATVGREAWSASVNPPRTEAHLTTAVPTMIQRSLQRCADQHEATRHKAQARNDDCADIYRRLAAICERESRWFGVLHRWVYGVQGTVPLVFGLAVSRAQTAAMADARYWVDKAERVRHDDQSDQLEEE